MPTISYPHLPACEHQSGEEHLQSAGDLIHCREAMHTAGSELNSIYAPVTAEPKQIPQRAVLEVYVRTRVLRCGCDFQMEIPDKAPSPVPAEADKFHARLVPGKQTSTWGTITGQPT